MSSTTDPKAIEPNDVLAARADERLAHAYDEIATHLPAETKMYVPKVEATILRREGVVLEKLKLPKSER